MPRVSSERRRYAPIGYVPSKIICSDANQMILNATLYHFGVLTSSIHMAWLRTVGGRLESRYRYSKDFVYNNFVWIEPTDKQKQAIEQSVQAILRIRKKHPYSTFADLYDPLTMPYELRQAHRKNDLAVARAYGLDNLLDDEPAIAIELLKRYEAVTI